MSNVTDYDVPYTCACCGKYTTFYLCSRCAMNQSNLPEEVAAKDAELARLRKVAEAAEEVMRQNNLTYVPHRMGIALGKMEGGEVMIDITKKEDGNWIRFKSSDGSEALINLDHRGPIVQRVVMESVASLRAEVGRLEKERKYHYARVEDVEGATKAIMAAYLDEGFARVDFRESECYLAAIAVQRFIKEGK